VFAKVMLFINFLSFLQRT